MIVFSSPPPTRKKSPLEFIKMTLPNNARRLLLIVSLLLVACVATPPAIPDPLVKARPEISEAVAAATATESATSPTLTTGLESTPKPPLATKNSTIRPNGIPVAASNEEANITVAFDQMPLPNFVQAIYSLILKKNYSLDPQVAARKDLVTLRAAQLQTASQIENAARLLLKTYGVAVTDLGAGNYRIVPDNAQTGYAPEIFRGRALPDVPLPLRPVYQLIELQALRSSEVAGWLTKIFDKKVNIVDDFSHNTLIISGQSSDVTSVLAAIQVLDQPLMKGRQSQRINPVFWTADELGKKLNDILTTEGYAVTNAALGSASIPISLMPIQGINALIVFASDPAIMQHIIDWAQKLDKPNPDSGADGGYFTYRVRHTNAEGLAKTMQDVLGEMQVSKPASGSPSPGIAAAGGAATGSRSSKVVINAATNTLIFQGDSKNQIQLFNLLQELDKPAKSALIEVTVAEVSLDDTTQLGVEWAFGASGASYLGGTRGGIALGNSGLSTGGIGISTGGLTIGRLNSAGDLRAMLNLLATSSKANVLSSPRILARNGETATIQVGSEIPTITQQQTSSATAGSTGVLQSVQYRNTGVILKVKPMIYAGDRIDLDVTQEVSDSTKVGVAGSPIIDTRKVETHLSLKDGSPVLLGGLISQNTSRAETGVPLLKDIPGVGQLFRTNTDNARKTEMLVLITPYIVADDHDATEITNAFRKQLGDWARPKAIVPTVN
jgi:general secretion pathway protein D